MYVKFEKVYSVNFSTQTVEIKHNDTVLTYPIAYVTGRPNPDTLVIMQVLIIGTSENNAVAILFTPKEYGPQKEKMDIVNAQAVI